MSTQELNRIERMSGWGIAASVVLFSIGVLRAISGISYLFDSRKVNDLTGSLLGDNLWAWGVWDLIVAALALYAANSLIRGGTYGKVFAYLWAVFVIVNSFLIIGVAPWFAAASIALAVLVVYGVARATDEASRTT
jgi:hypothetical protein